MEGQLEAGAHPELYPERLRRRGLYLGAYAAAGLQRHCAYAVATGGRGLAGN